MADNILRGTIKIEAPGVKETANNIAANVEKMSNAFKTSAGIIVQSGLSWNQFVAQLKGPTKAAYKEATGEILSCGEAMKVLGREFQNYKAQGLSVSQVTQKIAEDFAKVGNVKPQLQLPQVTGGGNLDFSAQFEAATQKINASIDAMVSKALGVEPVLESVGNNLSFDPAIRSLNQLQSEMDELKTKILGATSIGDIQKLSAQFGVLEKEALKLKDVFSSVSKLSIDTKIAPVIPAGLVQQVQAFGGGVRSLQAPLNATSAASKGATSSIQRMHYATGASTQTLINFGRILQDAPFGLIGIANNINPVVEGFKSLSLEAKAAGTSVGTQLLTALKGAGGLALGFSVITAAIQFAVVGLDMWTRGFGKSSEKTSAYKQKIDDLKKAFEELKATTTADILGGASSEFSKAVSAIETLKENVKLAKQGFIDKKEVVNQYNKELGDTIGKVKTLDEVEQVLASKADAYIKFTLLKAAAQQALQKASDAALKAAEEQSNIKQTTSLSGFVDPKIVGQNAYQKFVGQLKTATKENEKNISDAERQKDRFINIFKDFQDQAAKIAKDNKFKFNPEVKIDEPKGQKFNFLFDFLPFDPSGKLKPQQKGQLLDAADRFSKEFAGIFKRMDFATKAKSEDEKIKLAIQFDADLKAGKVQFDLSKIKEATDKGLKAEDLIPEDKLQVLSTQVVDQFIKGFQNASEQVKNANPLNLSPSFKLDTDLQSQIDLFKTTLRRIGAQVPKDIQATDIFGNPIVISIDDLIDTSKIANSDALKALQDALQKIRGQLKDAKTQLDSDLKSIFGSFASSGFTNLGESIGAALASGADPIVAAGKSIIMSVGDLISQIGKALIEYGVVKEGLDKILVGGIAIPGVTAIALGVAAVAIGALVKNAFSKNAIKRNSGGDVPGVGNSDTVPAMLTPGEFVANKQDAPLVKAFLKVVKGGFGIGKILGGVQHFATGGDVKPFSFSPSALMPNRTVQTTNYKFSPVPITVRVKGQLTGQSKTLVAIIDQEIKSQSRNR